MNLTHSINRILNYYIIGIILKDLCVRFSLNIVNNKSKIISNILHQTKYLNHSFWRLKTPELNKKMFLINWKIIKKDTWFNVKYLF